MLRLRVSLRVALLCPAIFAHELLDMRRGAVACDVREHRFVPGCGDTRSHLRIRELASSETGAHFGQMLERASDADLRARGRHTDTTLPVQPVRRTWEAMPRIRFAAIEFGDEHQ